MPSPIHLPEIPDAERSPLVERLVVLIEVLAQENQRQAETLQQLRDEIAVLKGSTSSGPQWRCHPDRQRLVCLVLQHLQQEPDQLSGEAHLDALGIASARHRRIATEGTLLGGLIDKGFSLDLVIVSDGAGQFAILLLF